METGLSFILIILLICLAVFMLLREVMLWYWRINKRIEIFEKNNVLIEQNNVLLEMILYELGSDGFVIIENKNGTKQITVSAEDWLKIRLENKEGFRIVPKN